jgi:hypothetical protein
MTYDSGIRRSRFSSFLEHTINTSTSSLGRIETASKIDLLPLTKFAFALDKCSQSKVDMSLGSVRRGQVTRLSRPHHTGISRSRIADTQTSAEYPSTSPPAISYNGQ